MNTLKKKIIYYYLIVTVILLIGEWYLFHLLTDRLSLPFIRLNLRKELCELIGLFLCTILFFAVSWIYYKIVSKSILEESEKQVKERNLLFANISHDLKNPMSTVLGYARALEEGKVPLDKQQVIFQKISEKTNQMNEMILKMFSYAKMESDGYSLHLTETDLCAFMRNILANRFPEIEKAEIKAEFDIPEQTMNVWIDQNEFARVINNLISNVIIHNEKGIKLLVKVEKRENIKITVADSGKPIPKEMQNTIFEPFICSDESREKKDGSGLGLAITKRIVHLHNGKIYFNDKIPGYTKAFVIEL